MSRDDAESYFQKHRPPDDDPTIVVQNYDFRRPDRIAKNQFRALQRLHEDFARNLASNLSAFLRAYVAVNFVSVEQVTFAEFSQPFASPTYLVVLGLKPLDGHAVLEMSPSLVFPVLEVLLGGTGRNSEGLERKIT